MPKKSSEPNFESSLAELEKLVASMESGDLSLEEALATFEKGIKLTRSCQQALDQAEQKIQILTQGADGIQAEPFELQDESDA